MLRDVKHDRARLEEAELAFFVSRNLTEWMQPAMCGFFHRRERKQSNVVGLTHFLQRPANAHVARQPPAAIG